ncbi:MAG: Do family serine endopeptidase [Acidobacteria bacterium]|nr:Do family serine endopeptidase [Acidobacteriota bacterium]
MSLVDRLRTQKLLSTTLILFTLSVGILIGTLLNTGVKAKDQAAPGAKPLVVPSPVQVQNAFAQLAKQLEPSVVHISTTYEAKPQQQSRLRGRRQPEEEEGADPFGRFFGFGSPFDMPRQRRGAATGSGVIIDPNGYIITNNHVVDKADRIQVTLFNETAKRDAKLIGTDPATDLAVIKIDSKDALPAAKIGNSDAIQVGDWAVAIGSPFGLQATVTAGIISAKERDLGGREYQFQRFLQTDAAINPGNSGGPLLNINGEVIGINTAIASGTGGYQGIGFAMPINTAAKIYNSIIKSGKVTRGAIGVEFRDSAPELLAVYGAKEGVFVDKVTPGMPADKAGIREADVIVSLNGKPVRNGQDLVSRISDMEVGAQIQITVLREQKPKEFKVTVGDRTAVVDAGMRPERSEESEKGEATPARFGMSLQNLTQARKDAMAFHEKGGVQITDIQPGSFADDIGLLPNDVVLSINRRPVESVEDVRKIQSGLKSGDPVAFRVMRPNGSIRGGRTEWTSLFLAGTLRDAQ